MILICGGAGYIGSYVNKFLNKNGYKTVVVDNLITGYKDFVKWGKFYKGDIGDRNFLSKVFKENKIKAVMHFSAFSQVGESVKLPSKYYVNNFSNTVNLLNLMIENDVKYFIFSSTAAVYGNPVKVPIEEVHPLNPINPYGRSKLMVETLLKDYDQAYGIKSVCLRYFNAAGADPELEVGERHDPETHLIPLAIYNLLGLKEKIDVYGTKYNTPDGSCIRDYIHIHDLAKAHLLAVEWVMSENKSDVFNLGNGKGFSVIEVLKACEKVSGKKLNINFTSPREGDPSILVASSKKAKRTLGWKADFCKIEDIIETAYRWHIKDIDFWSKNEKKDYRFNK